MTSSEHRRGLVVGTLFAATVLTLAGCSGHVRHVGSQVAEEACQNAAEGWFKGWFKKAAQDAGQEVLQQCPDAVDYVRESDSDGDSVPDVYDRYPSDPFSH